MKKIPKLLEKIISNKRKEIESTRTNFEDIKRAAHVLAKTRTACKNLHSFLNLFHKSPVLIAEIKPKSPSKGVLIEKDPREIADIYEKSEVDAISVLTDEKYFGGSTELLKSVRARVTKPILRKDFIIDEYQIYETALIGADAFLLIASILSVEELRNFQKIGNELGIDAIVEVHTEEEMQKAISFGAKIIGINNRNLNTLEIDLLVTETLVKFAPEGVIIVSESGIESGEDARRLCKLGVSGMLIGTSILRSEDPAKLIKDLKNI